MLFYRDSAVQSVFAFPFALSADHSLNSAPTLPTLAGGRHTGAIRCTSVISAVLAETAASQLCQFSGHTGTSRLSFQRKLCEICNKNAIIPVVVKHVQAAPQNAQHAAL